MGCNLDHLATEQNNPGSMDIDLKSTREMIEIFHQEDSFVPEAVHKEAASIEAAIDGIVDRLKDGGSLYYIGCGTSGRLGILDASECPPTFGTDPHMVVGLIAGGDKAIRCAVEGAEDNLEAGKTVIAEHGIGRKDAVVGIAASGRTPYVMGALMEAKKRGAFTAALSNTSPSQIGKVSDVSIEVVTGPEVITGSTRLKAGTAQKVVLNMISTISMIRLGKVYKNYMVDLIAGNEKLEHRVVSIVSQAAQVSEDEAGRLLKEADGSAKKAILMALTGITAEQAGEVLASSKGFLRAALAGMGRDGKTE